MSTIFTTAAQGVFGKMRAMVGRCEPGAWDTASRLAIGEPERRWGAGQEQRPKEASLEPIERSMLHVVRRALRKEADTSPLTGRIHALARQMAGTGWSQAQSQREALVRAVAREICYAMKKRQGE